MGNYLEFIDENLAQFDSIRSANNEWCSQAKGEGRHDNMRVGRLVEEILDVMEAQESLK